MVHPYTNQKLETFTRSPIVHASMMYPIVLSVLTNTCPVAILNTKSILFFLKSMFPSCPLIRSVTRCMTTSHYRSRLQSNKVTAVFILNSLQFKKICSLIQKARRPEQYESASH